MEWNDLELALALARCGTLSSGARRLGVDQTTVSRRLKALERALGIGLFQRDAGRLVPTDAGAAILARAERVESEILGLREELSGGVTRCAGLVRLTSVPVIVNRLLLPNMRDLLATHPEMQLELIADGMSLSFSRREADIALRLARPRGGGAVCRRVGTLSYSAYGPAGTDPTTAPWLTYDEAHDDLPQARWVAEHDSGPGTIRVRCNDAEGLLAAARAGLGKVLLPDMVAADDPALAPIPGQERVLTRELWLLVHPDLRPLRRIQVVAAWLAELCRTLDQSAPWAK